MDLEFITAILAPGAAKSTKHEYVSSSGDDKQSFGSKIAVSGLPPLFIPGKQGGFIDVTVAYIESTDKFFCQLQDQAEDIIQMWDELNVYYAQPDAKSLFNPVTGTLCAAKYSADNCWYRAYVLDRPTATSLEVYFLDYGNIEKVCKVDVKILVPQFVTQPPRAFPCKLKQVQTTPDVVSKFLACGDGYNFILKLENVVASVFEVTAFDVNLDTKEECNINDYLNGRPTCVPSKLCVKQRSGAASASIATSARAQPPSVTVNGGEGSQKEDLAFGAAANAGSGNFGRRDVCKSSGNGFEQGTRPAKGFAKDFGGDGGSNFNSRKNEGNTRGFGDRGGGRGDFRDQKGSRRGDGENSSSGNWRNTGFVGSGQASTNKEPARLPADNIAATFATQKEPIKSVSDWGDDETITIAENVSSPKCSAPPTAQNYATASPPAVDAPLTPAAEKMAASTDSLPSSFPPFALPRDDSETYVFVAWAVNLDEFYVQLVSQEDELHTVTEKLQTYCVGAAQKFLSVDSVHVGMACAAEYADDHRFYRCTVTKVDGQNANVRFVDYGNDEVVPVKELYKLSDEFVSYPRYAVRCCFKHLAPVSPDDSSSFKSDVDSLAVDQLGDPVVFRCRFLTKVEPCEVQLKREDTGLDDMLVSLKHFVKL